MSSEKRKRKRKGITGKNTLIALLIGVLIGGAAIYSTTSYFQPRVPTPISLPAEIASVPAQSATPSSTPTGWDTEWSQKLNIRLLAQFDSSGQPAWDAAQHPLVYISSNGPGYGGFLSGIKSPGLVIIDANTYQVVLTKQYAVEGVKNYYESHGSGVSMDGKWIYIPTADSDKPKEQSGLLLVIDAKTLKLHQIIQTESVPHHVKAFRLYDGRDVVLSYTFNWQIGSGPMGPGSGVWLMDPNDNNRIVGGIRSEQLQGNPYLAFPHPDGEHLFISMPPGPIRDPDIREKLEGTIAVVDMKTWQPVKYYIAGTEVEKGEASHNRGKLLGLVDPIAMRPVDSFVTGGLRADHAILHPDPARNEIWISYNSNFRDVVFDLDKKEVKTSIIHSGSTHNGAFVEYAVLPNGDWKGSLESDQAGLHNSSLDLKLKMLGVTQTIYGSEKLPVESARATGQ
ncbi:MAG: hypothetical protein HYY68_01450 [Thaumarchaeota archaeon]|nr:hypothetical protein [Nitrososphaerota archaeon]